MRPMRSVGKNAPRREGPEKLTGRAKYLDDLALPGAWHGVTVRSSVPHGRIKAIRFDPAFPWDQCVVVTAKDIPGKNLVTLIETDQPLLAEGVVRHREEGRSRVEAAIRGTSEVGTRRKKEG